MAHRQAMLLHVQGTAPSDNVDLEILQFGAEPFCSELDDHLGWVDVANFLLKRSRVAREQRRQGRFAS